MSTWDDIVKNQQNIINSIKTLGKTTYMYTDEFKQVSDLLNNCNNSLKKIEDILQDAKKIEVDDSQNININGDIAVTQDSIDSMMSKIRKIMAWIKNKAEAWENAERQNISAGSGISSGASVGAMGGSVSSVATNTSSSSATSPSNLENKVQTQTPTDTEDLNKDINPKLDENVPDTQVEAIIELLYGENPTLTDDERQSIAEAIGQINKTGILEGLDEDTANKITSLIVKDALEGKLDLTNITAESLQEYIESQPSININLELNESIQNFDELIKEGQLTEEQVNSVINNQIQIYDTDASFIEAYKNAGGTSTDISKVEAFYDTTTQTIHMRNTVDSTVITNSIILALDEPLFFDEITGKVIYSQTATDLDFGGTIEVIDKNNNTETNTQVDLNDSITSDTQVNVNNNAETTETQVDLNDVIGDTQTQPNKDTNISE